MTNQNSRPLSEFEDNAAEVVEIINRTDQVEILTVEGEARAILLSPKAYADLARDAEVAQDVANIRRSVAQIEQGQFQDADAFFSQLREELLKMNSARG